MVPHKRLIDHHIELREFAAEALYRTALVAEKLESTVRHGGQERRRAELLRESAQRLLDDQFTLSIVGEFSRGKSTLINALLGHEDLLPTAIEPATAAITVLSRGETANATIIYEDGTREENVSPADLPKYVLGRDLDGRDLQSRVTQKVARFRRAGKVEDLTAADVEDEVKQHLEETKPGREIALVELTYPSEFLADGIRLVDTPGLGSVNPRHGEATRNFITQSDAVLFLINTDPVISASECNFLAFLQDYVEQFLFVVTKIDRYTKEERERSLGYTRDTIAEYAGITMPKVFPVSARLALDGQVPADSSKFERSGFPEFLLALDEFLVDGRGQRIMREYVGTARLHARELRKAVEVELQGIDLSLDELRQRSAHAREQFATAREARKRVLGRLDYEIEHGDDLVMGPTQTIRFRITSAIRDDLHAQLAECDWDELQQAPQIIPIFVSEIIGEKLQDHLDRTADHLGKLHESLSEECCRVIQDLDANLGFEFQQPCEFLHEELHLLPNPERFRASLGRITTDTIGSTLAVALADGFQFGGIGALVMVGGGMLARTALGGTFRERARDQIKQAVEAPLRDLVDKILLNVKEAVVGGLTAYRAAMDETLDRAIGELEESVSRLERETQSTEFNTTDRREELKRELGSLDDIEELLSQARSSSA